MRAYKIVLLFVMVTVGTNQLRGQGVKILSLAELSSRDTIERSEQPAPHKVIANVYYIGPGESSSFLIVTPAGHILINSNSERYVPAIRKSVEALGFRFEDIRIVLGSHAHSDHMEGDALVKQLTGAQVMAMDRDIPLLMEMRPGGKAHPIDRILKHRDQVTLGGMTLVAHLTPGHTPGNTTWTFTVQDGDRSYDVAVMGSMRLRRGTPLINNKDYPQIMEDYIGSFKYSRSLPCDIFLASHPDMYNMTEKYDALAKNPSLMGTPLNPFIDPQGWSNELTNWENAFTAVLEQQKNAVTSEKR